MSCQIGINSFFGANSYIKLLNSDIVAIEGPNTVERLIAGDIKIPYKQLLKSRIILKPGQLAYLMNHLGLGDNATFVAIIARYDAKSVNEEDNYLEYYYTDETGTIRNMDQMMILTGNSTHRIPQLYFNNPNTTYKVTLDVMVAVIDDNYSFYLDTTNQSGLSFFNLECNSIKSNIETFVVNESIVIYDNKSPRNPLVYLTLNEISSIHLSGKILIIDENTIGKIYLEFISIYDVKQALSLIDYVTNNSNIIIQNLVPIIDNQSPIVHFKHLVGNTGNYIKFQGLTATSYNTSYGNTFSTSISLNDYGTASGTALNKTTLNNLLINSISDNRDGVMYLSDSNIHIYDYSLISTNSIVTVGTYSLKFDLSDVAGNFVDVNATVLLSIVA